MVSLQVSEKASSRAWVSCSLPFFLLVSVCGVGLHCEQKTVFLAVQPLQGCLSSLCSEWERSQILGSKESSLLHPVPAVRVHPHLTEVIEAARAVCQMQIGSWILVAHAGSSSSDCDALLPPQNPFPVFCRVMNAIRMLSTPECCKTSCSFFNSSTQIPTCIPRWDIQGKHASFGMYSVQEWRKPLGCLSLSPWLAFFLERPRWTPEGEWEANNLILFAGGVD